MFGPSERSGNAVTRGGSHRHVEARTPSSGCPPRTTNARCCGALCSMETSVVRRSPRGTEAGPPWSCWAVPSVVRAHATVSPLRTRPARLGTAPRGWRDCPRCRGRGGRPSGRCTPACGGALGTHPRTGNGRADDGAQGEGGAMRHHGAKGAGPRATARRSGASRGGLVQRPLDRGEVWWTEGSVRKPADATKQRPPPRRLHAA